MKELRVTAEQNDLRLDHLLTEEMSISRSQIQKRIKSGDITLNQLPAAVHTFVKTGDVISYATHEEHATKPKVIPNIEVLFENNDLIVINKPAGLVAHNTISSKKDVSVVDWFLSTHPDLSHIGEDPTRPGIVHRLDKDVSGVMVIAKTQAMFENLKEQFQTRTVEKIYLALAYGLFAKDHDVINLKIARSKARGRMVARTEEQEGKDASTEYDVLERFKVATYLRVKIHTGRTHQIRVHFQAIDHALFGDKLYKKKYIRHVKQVDIGRIFLHATQLTIALANGDRQTFNSPLPKELQTILDALPKN